MRPGERRFRESLRRFRESRRRRSYGWLEKAWPWLFRLLALIAAALLANRLGDSELILRFLEAVSG